MASPKFRASKIENGEIVEVTLLETGEVLSMAAFLQRQAEGATVEELREAEQRTNGAVRKAAQDELWRRGHSVGIEHDAESPESVVLSSPPFPQHCVEKFTAEHRIAGMQYMMRKRNVASPSEDRWPASSGQ